MNNYLETNSATLTTGDDVIVISGHVDMSIITDDYLCAIKSGQYLIPVISGTSPNSAGNSSIKLATPWTGTNISNSDIFLFPTFANVANTMTAMTALNDVSRGILSRFNDLLTSSANSIDIRVGATATITTTPYQYLVDRLTSLINQLNTSIENIQNDNQQKIDIASRKAIADMRLPEPDVFIPFNDGIEMQVGYGVRNSFGNKAINFSRASGTGNINKSGVSESLGINEPAIESGGLGCYETFTNIISKSSKLNETPWEQEGAKNISIISTNNKNSERLLTATLIEDNSTIVAEYARQVITINSDSFVVFSFEVKANTSVMCSARVASTGGVNVFSQFDFDLTTNKWITPVSNNMTLFSPKVLNDGWVRLSIGVDGGFANTVLDLRVYPTSKFDATSTGRVLIDRVQVTETIIPMPYVETNDAPVTRAMDIAKIPIMGNMPAAGKPFTIIADCAYGHAALFANIFTLPGDTGGVSTNGGSEYFQMRDTDEKSVYSGFTGGHVERGVSRYAARYDGVSIALFRDGILVSSNDFNGTPKYGNYMSDNLDIGENGKINSCVKNFGIFHRALTDTQILALGRAE
jgi:hypothetical protein